jgi:predicted regulator of amino acid metabolism with ACT domain
LENIEGQKILNDPGIGVEVEVEIVRVAAIFPGNSKTEIIGIDQILNDDTLTIIFRGKKKEIHDADTKVMRVGLKTISCISEKNHQILNSNRWETARFLTS